jgi:RNA polymerase sigma-70 factor (ECF subfamily)
VDLVRNDSDESLMLLYREGDMRAFEVLVERHRKPVYNFILRFVRNTTQAEDLLQDTFLRVVKSADSYERQAKFTTWLYTIARNLCVDASRRGRHRQVDSLDALIGSDNGRTRIEFVPDLGAGVERRAIGSELRAQIQNAIEMLPEEQREIFLLREVADLQFNEIAAVIGCPENTVKSRMRYALEKLREELAEFRDLAEAVS